MTLPFHPHSDTFLSSSSSHHCPPHLIHRPTGVVAAIVMGKRKFHFSGHHNKKKKSSSSSSSSSSSFGPFKVTKEEEGRKIFQLCHSHFSPHLSKKQLHHCFYSNEVFLNDQPLLRQKTQVLGRPCHGETYQVQENDEIKIIRNMQSLQEKEVDEVMVTFVFSCDGLAVVRKEAGVSVASSCENHSGGVFEEAVRQKLSWNKGTDEVREDEEEGENEEGDMDMQVPEECVMEIEDDKESKSDERYEDEAEERNMSTEKKRHEEGNVIKTNEAKVEEEGRNNEEGSEAVAINTNHAKEGHLLYRLEKSIEGLCLVARSTADRDTTLAMIDNGHLSLFFTCVVAGYHGEDETVHTLPLMTVRVVAVCRSRSAIDQRVSQVEVCPNIHEMRKFLGLELLTCDSMTTMVRHVKKALKSYKMTLVGGEEGLLKKEKGHFISLTKIKILVPHDEEEINSLYGASSLMLLQLFDCCENGFAEYAIEVPPKFTKLFEREAALYAAAVARDRSVLEKKFSDPLVLENKCRELEEGSPVEYLTGCVMFCGFEFIVTTDVMIPRRSSETLVHEVLSQVAYKVKTGGEESKSCDISILDIGVGSGCLLLSSIGLLQQKFPQLSVSGVGIDICPKAIAVANRNAAELGLSSAVSFLQHGMEEVDTLNSSFLLSFDLIVCNPPYSSATGDESRLSHSRRAHEPALALFTKDGSEPTSLFTDLAKSFLRSFETKSEGSLFKSDARIIVEFGHGQMERVKEIFKEERLHDYIRFIRSSSDYNKLQRCLVYGVK